MSATALVFLVSIHMLEYVLNIHIGHIPIAPALDLLIAVLRMEGRPDRRAVYYAD